MDIRRFCLIFNKKNNIGKVSSLKDIASFFKKLKEGIENDDFSSLIIGDYLYTKITSKKVRIRKSSATEFEDFLDFAFEGKVTDNETRKNIISKEIKNIDSFIAIHISSNRREKMDIIFPSQYGLSLKTSVPENKEINLGSFAREALFKDFLTAQEYGGERKNGLGSKPQIKLTLNKIKEKGKWDDFSKRFKLMVENIYVDDSILIIKADKKIEIYFIPGEKLRKTLIDAVDGGPEKAINVLNRYEGNSIRVERDKITACGEKIEIDFSKIEDSKLKKIINSLGEVENNLLEFYCNKDFTQCEKFLLNKFKEIIKEIRE